MIITARQGSASHDTPQPPLQYYKPRLERSGEVAGLPVATGTLESSKYLALGFALLLLATFRGAKSFMAKVQLGIAYVLVLTLLFAWIVAAYALYVAAGWPTVPWLDGVFGENVASWSLTVGVVGVASWQVFRRKILALASTTQRLIDYTNNRDRIRDTVGMSLDDAVAGLLDNGYREIHVIGYSLGSLVLFDAAFPKIESLKAQAPMDAVTSMTTIGCPLDMARLFYPSYMSKRRDGRKGTMAWINIFNAADVFGSNLVDRSDGKTEVPPAGRRSETGGHGEGYVPIRDRARSYRYLDERLNPWQVLKARGFRVHGRYWGEADEAHCFEPFVALLLKTRS